MRAGSSTRSPFADDAGDPAVVRSQQTGRRHPGPELCTCLHRRVGQQTVEYATTGCDQHVHAGALLDPPYLRLALDVEPHLRDGRRAAVEDAIEQTPAGQLDDAATDEPVRRQCVARQSRLVDHEYVVAHPRQQPRGRRPGTPCPHHHNVVHLPPPSLDGTTLRRSSRQMLGEEVEGRWRVDLHEFSTLPSAGSQAVAPDASDG